jgi:hypothetical protein
MSLISDVYGILVLTLSAMVLMAVWKVHKDKVKADLHRIALWLHRRH